MTGTLRLKQIVGPVKCPNSMSTTNQTQMTFTDALIASGYYFQPESVPIV
jgi:hypothetical protein